MQIFFNPCPKREQPEQHFITVTRLIVITLPIYLLIPTGIIGMNKDFGGNMHENQENGKSGTETQINFTRFHVEERNCCAGNAQQ